MEPRVLEKRIKIIRDFFIPTLFLFLFFVVILLPLCARTQLWIDEVLDSDPAFNLAFHNKLALSVLEGINKLEEHFFIRPPVYSLVLASLYKIFGFQRWVTLSVSLIPAALSFCIVYAIAILFTRDFWISLASSLLLGLGGTGMTLGKGGRSNALAFFLFTLSLFIFSLVHLVPGLGGRFFMLIKDWQKRNLVSYEQELEGLKIPTGSIVLGGPENWYVLGRRGVKLLLFECAHQPTFDWKKLDYVIMPVWYDLSTGPPLLSGFIQNSCSEIARIGKEGYRHNFNLIKFSQESGYSSIVFKSKK